MDNKMTNGNSSITLKDNDLNCYINFIHKCSSTLDLNIIKDNLSESILTRLKEHILKNITVVNNEPIERSMELNIKLNLEILKDE